MITPDEFYIGTMVRLTAHFTDLDGNNIDPDTVAVRIMGPNGTQSTLSYGADQDIGQTSAGHYYADYIPMASGRFNVRWETGEAANTYAVEGDFLVKKSPFYDGRKSAY